MRLLQQGLFTGLVIHVAPLSLSIHTHAHKYLTIFSALAWPHLSFPPRRTLHPLTLPPNQWLSTPVLD
jgi:hypothetical protein